MEADEITVMPVENSENSEAPVLVEFGSAFLAFEERAPESAKKQLRDSTASILSRCAREPGAEPKTGLVVGQVQSGKTLSFEGLICLAHDNGFPLVIVISGSSTALLGQTTDRLERDLMAASPGSWRFLVNPGPADVDATTVLSSAAKAWSGSGPAGRKKTVVVTVLKHYGRLTNLADALQSVGWPADLPVLIVDDEADQASLNSQASEGDVSTTHAVILQLRQSLDVFSYIEYTATPQATLLSSIANSLSPEFVRVLDAGEGYVGGETLFAQESPYLDRILDREIVDPANPPLAPPDSFVKAFRIYFLGLAYSLLDDEFAGPLSMLVHPSHGTPLHGQFELWARSMRDLWREILEQRASRESDFASLIEEFEDARSELLKTIGDFPSMEHLVDSLEYALSDTQIIEMNANPGITPTPNWPQSSGFVLVGGQALDRGFTVEGLTVTYMPRGVGVGNADSIQQRARFFGYKGEYLGLIRVFLPDSVRHAFEVYVDHEADIRRRLQDVEASGQSLKNWAREFFLDPALKPTRSGVQTQRLMRGNAADKYVYDTELKLDPEVVRANSDCVDAYLAGIDFEDVPGHPDRTAAQRNKVSRGHALRGLLELLKSLDGPGSYDYAGVELTLSSIFDANAETQIDLYLMRPDAPIAERTLETSTRFTYLFQGETNASASLRRGEQYPGDLKIHSDERISVQFHRINIKEPNSGSIVAHRVPVMAVRIPAAQASPYVIQADS